MTQYIVLGWDGTDEKALDRRMDARPAHFEKARQLKGLGIFIFGGAILDENGKMIGSTMVVQFPTEIALQDWLKTEPYIIGEVWNRFEVRRFKVADV